MRLIPILLCAVLAGCAWQSDVLKVGDDTYQVSADAAPARGGVAGAQNLALKSANAKCDSLHRSIEVVNIETGHDFPAAGRAVITFKCK